ncbi:MAG: DUF4423 domain-containing protein [Bdellovibrionota bacterium]
MKRDPFVEILKSEFKRKRLRNQAYSLRSFSRDLEIDASNLSKILSYQKLPGMRMKQKLASRIGLSPADLELCTSAKVKDGDYSGHSLQTFEVIAGWQHYAILELLKLKDFDPSPKQMAARLGIDSAEIVKSLKRLRAVGLIEETDGKLKAAESSSSSILSTVTSKAHRDQQKEILAGAIEALDATPIEHRSQSSMTFAVDVDKLDEARDLIKSFRRSMGRLLSESENLTQVYQLSVSLYPVTKPSSKAQIPQRPEKKK